MIGSSFATFSITTVFYVKTRRAKNILSAWVTRGERFGEGSLDCRAQPGELNGRKVGRKVRIDRNISLADEQKGVTWRILFDEFSR